MLFVKTFTLIFILAINFNCCAQSDTLKHNLTTNVALMLIFQEAGIYYDYRVNQKSYFELSYAHRFHNLTIVKNGAEGGEYKIRKQTGDFFRVGYKINYTPKKPYETYLPYRYFMLSYVNLHTPKYLTSNGSNGLSSTKREIISADKNLINLSIGFGRKEYISDHLLIDIFLVFGLSSGIKKTHKYSYGNSGNEFNYPKGTYEKTTVLYPTIEVGFNFGLGW